MSNLVQGWDAVLTIGFGAVNETFAEALANGLIPAAGKRSYAFAAGAEQTEVVVTAKIGAWRILEARGSKITVAFILTGGSLSYSDQHVDLTRLDYKVTVPLRLEEFKTSEGINYTLTLDFADKNTVAVPNMNAIAGQIPRNDLIGLNAVLTDFFFDALSGGEVDLVRLDAPAWSQGRKWLTPKSAACSSVTRSAREGALGLLLATVSAPPRGEPELPDLCLDEEGGSSLSLSNELFTKHFVAPAFAKTLGVPVKNLNVRPGRPWTLESAGPVVVENATISRAKAMVSKGLLRINTAGVSKFWGGAAVSFEIDAEYEVVVGGKGPVRKMAFRRLSRKTQHKLQIPTAAKAVTLGSTGLHTSRAEEILETMTNRLAPERLGSPISLDLMSGIKWPFGRVFLPNSSVPAGRLTLVISPSN